MATLLFDADDTLWENNTLFLRVSEDFFAWLAHPDAAHARAVRDEIEEANIRAHGYGSRVFLRSLRECVERLRDRPLTTAEHAEIDALAVVLQEYRMELVPGVADLLADLGTRHDLRMVTKGQVEEQQAKIDASGLAPLFTSTHVVARKEPSTYRGLVTELNLDPAATWMIGNSPRSDILPARAAGLGAVYVPHPAVWEHEHADIDDEAVLHLTSLHELTRHF